MEVVIGKLAGFCPGVENTIKKAREILEKNKNVYCLGEIVHNKQVIEELEKNKFIDGYLIGGACLDPNKFLDLINEIN